MYVLSSLLGKYHAADIRWLLYFASILLGQTLFQTMFIMTWIRIPNLIYLGREV